jgi:alkylated DNA repair protein alkB family protein 1
MGYQYDWTARAYHEGAKSPMPVLLEEVASIFARTSLSVCESTSTKFTAGASIVNYYRTKSIMGGHRDDLELALDKPVISLSLGLPAVFLLGGKTKEDEPVLPILVRPGDVLILGGESRLCYHGMARVLPAAVVLPNVSEDFRSPQSFQLTRASVLSQRDGSEREPRSAVQATVPDSDQVALRDYLSTHRININVRQVLPDAMTTLPPVPTNHDDK